VGVCGELAGDPVAAPILVGLGVDELSMNPGSVPRVKDLLRRVELKTAQEWAGRVLATESAAAARKIAQDYIKMLEVKI
jgi:phosphoenolpyruvate-protein kinase (PTS system EI component)